MRYPLSNSLKKAFASLYFVALLTLISPISLEATTSTKYLTLWHTQTKHQAELIKSMVLEFNQNNKKVKIVAEEIMDINSALIKGALQGHLPDMALAPGDIVGLYKSVNFSKIPAEILIKPSFTSLSSLNQIEGETYGIPILGGNFLMLYYNKSLIKKPAPNWETMKLHKKELFQKGHGLISWWYLEPYYFIPFLSPFLAKVINDGQPQLNHPEIHQAFSFYHTLAKEKLVEAECDYECSMERFFAGKDGYMINGDWALQFAYDRLGKNLGIAPLPKINNKQMAPVQTGFSLFFPRNSLEGPWGKQLTEFAKYFQSPEVHRRWKDIKRIPDHPQILDEMEKNPINNQLMEMLAQSIPLKDPSSMIYLWPVLKKSMFLILKNIGTSQSILPKMNQIAKELIKEKNYRLE